MKTGYLIVNYNDYESTKKLIDNIKDYKCLDKILIVDNRSKDDSYKKLRAIKNEKVEVIRTEENNGYSYAINIGCKKLKEELGKCNIIVSNSDIAINEEKDIITLLNLIKKKNIGIIAPTVLERGNLNRGWKCIGPWMEILLNIVLVQRLIRKKYIKYDDSYYNGDISYVDIVSGCFFVTTSEVLEKIDYLDENVFLYYEENILCRKLEKIDLKMAISNNSLVIHNHSITIDKNINKINKYNQQKKSQYYFEKNYNNANWFNLLLLRVTAFISKLILYVVYFIKDLFN